MPVKMSLEQLEDIVVRDPSLLEEYVLKNVDLDIIENWVIRKSQINHKKSLNVARHKCINHTEKRQMLQELEKYLHSQTEPNKINVLRQLAATVAFAVNSDQWNVFVYDSIADEMKRISDISQTNMNGFKKSDDKSETLVEYVYQSRSTIIGDPNDHYYRFKDGSPYKPPNTTSIMAVPVVQSDNSLMGVLELYKTKCSESFVKEDEEIVQSYLVWGGIALHYAELFSNLSRQRKLNTFLLTVVKSIFQDMISMDTVIAKIMEYAKKLVNADRTSLFLVDSNDNQLYAHIFEVNDNKNPDPPKSPCVKTEIRFPIGTGIAGYVAKTGQALNIPDAYEDRRFNRSIDQLTGYETKNLLCMPIFSKNKVIGVVQMVNKMNGFFNKVDEENFAIFATYCGLALDHARLYEKIRRSEQKNKVALEILSYHNMSNNEELEKTREQIVEFHPPNVVDAKFSPYDLNNDHKLLTTIKIFESIDGIPHINNDDLYRFTLSVRKNYRRVPYHNWTHGFSVAHSLYVFIHDSPRFSRLEKLAFFVSGLCHDLDHRGTTNQFLIHSSAPLAAIYTTSPLEHHHYNQTANILQQSGQNILKSLSTQEYKKVLSLIKHCILATDLALFFPNKAKLEKILSAGHFDWTSSEHKLLLEAIAMTAADLNSTARPWMEAREQVRVLFEEFYAQGDIEKQLGRKPIPLMDRDKVHEQPASQVDFLTNISIPCFKMLTQLLPNARVYLNHCITNLKLWTDKVEKEKKLREKLDLMSRLSEDTTSTKEISSVKPITKNRLERTKSLKH